MFRTWVSTAPKYPPRCWKGNLPSWELACPTWELIYPTFLATFKEDMLVPWRVPNNEFLSNQNNTRESTDPQGQHTWHQKDLKALKGGHKQIWINTTVVTSWCDLVRFVFGANNDDICVICVVTPLIIYIFHLISVMWIRILQNLKAQHPNHQTGHKIPACIAWLGLGSVGWFVDETCR